MTERSGGVSSGVSFCNGKSAPKFGEQTCIAAPLPTMIATVESVLRSVQVIDATNSSSTFTEETAVGLVAAVGTLVPVALETIVVRTAMLLVHSIVGILGHTVVDCAAPHSSVVVVGLCFAVLLLLLRCTLVHGNPLPCDPSVRICSMLLCLFLCLLAM